MAFNQTRRLRTEVLHADHMTLVALQALADYRPHNQNYTPEAISTLKEAVEQARQMEIRAENAYESARNAAIAAEWAMHNAILGAKTQVIAQYGPDSDAIQSLGLKRKSERKRPARRKAAQGERASG